MKNVSIVKKGDNFILLIDDDKFGLLYESTGNPLNPIQLIKTLSPKELKEYV